MHFQKLNFFVYSSHLIVGQTISMEKEKYDLLYQEAPIGKK